MNASNQSPVSAAQRRRNQFILIVLWFVPFGLMAVAGFVYYMVETGGLTLGSKNNGVLIRPPVPISELLAESPSLNVRDSNDDVQSIFAGKWTLVIRGDQFCNQSCRDALYLTRQLHIRLDKNANRVQRLYLFDVDNADTSDASNTESEMQLSTELADLIKSEHRLLKAIPVAEAMIRPIDAKLISGSGEKASFFIVDPQGWAMMYYLSEHDGNAILQDLKHLLKFSRER